MPKAAKRKTKAENSRIERDPLGEKRVPADALFGIQTFRALENFRISQLRIHPGFIKAYAEINKAADEIIDGAHGEQFDLDVFQAGAGTSYNMNLNEVIANRALVILKLERGAYEKL